MTVTMCICGVGLVILNLNLKELKETILEQYWTFICESLS